MNLEKVELLNELDVDEQEYWELLFQSWLNEEQNPFVEKEEC